jgi:hypothetical protein
MQKAKFLHFKFVNKPIAMFVTFHANFSTFSKQKTTKLQTDNDWNAELKFFSYTHRFGGASKSCGLFLAGILFGVAIYCARA